MDTKFLMSMAISLVPFSENTRVYSFCPSEYTDWATKSPHVTTSCDNFKPQVQKIEELFHLQISPIKDYRRVKDFTSLKNR